MRRTMNVEVASDASLFAVDAVLLGRTAMEEVVRTGFVSDARRIRRDGRLIYADTFRLTDELETSVMIPTVLAGHLAMASLIYIAPVGAKLLNHPGAAKVAARGTP